MENMSSMTADQQIRALALRFAMDNISDGSGMSVEESQQYLVAATAYFEKYIRSGEWS